MNPLFLLLGLFGSMSLGAFGGGTSSRSSPTGEDPGRTGKNKNPDIIIDDDDPVSGGHDHTHDDPVAGDDDPVSGGHDHTHDDPVAGDDDPVSGGHDHTHDDDLTVDIPPPGVGASQADINAYLDALAALPDGHTHDAGSSQAAEHMVAMSLVSRGEATSVAIGSGDWFDPSIWSNGEIPGDDAKVLIPEGVTVNYGGVSDARLFTVRVDGTLDFATNVDSQMIFDTMVTSSTGRLVIGTANNPVDPNVDIDLIIADNGPIDTNWDPMLLSRGMILHGETTIYGAEKDSHEKVTENPMEGDTSIKFAEVPEGWQIGDTIVIAGTHYDGYKWDNEIDGKRLYPPEDEERVITHIDDDGRVYFDDPLIHDHDTPRADLFTSVANYTRNVSVESENADSLEVYERGHVMFMHSDDVDVRYAEFYELGRTDKSTESRDISNISNIEYDSNVQGRYALHLHRTGTSDLDNPTILEGNAVYGSPGWGIVHHDSNALITNNATYDTFGAGYVAETGNETGVWSDNIAIWAQGTDWGTPKNTSTIGDNIFDTGRGGDGFWFQGRMVASIDNIAASVNNGFVYFHRDGDDRMIEFDASLFDYSAALYYDDDVRADDVPILNFQGNETFAANRGLQIVKANPNQGHDVWSHLDDFTAWSVKTGAFIEYTSHYLLTNFDVIGKDATQFSTAETGIQLGNNVTEIVIHDATIEGFKIGIDLNKFFTRSDWTPDLHHYVVIDANMTDVDQEYANYNSSLDRILDSSDLVDRAINLTLDGPLTYSVGSDASDNLVEISGTKTDSLGTVDFPGGTDTFEIKKSEVITILENKGYWTTSSGQNYFLVDIYLTDRVTGEIFYETHPVYLDSDVLSRSDYSDALFNGAQNITSQGGILFVGDTPLNTPIPAVPTGGITLTVEEILNQSALDHSSTTMSAMLMSQVPENSLEPTYGEEQFDQIIWMDGYDGEDTQSLMIDDGIFINTGEMHNFDVTATGGNTVLAAGGGSFHLGPGHILAVGDAANVGFDGENPDEIALLHLSEDSTLLFGGENGLGSIAEFRSGGFGEAPEVLSGINLGNANIVIDLSGISVSEGTAFTLMDADEIVGLFNEAIVGGLGQRDAQIVIDYENDSVTLELFEGTGAVQVDTLGFATDVTVGEEDLWSALTAHQGIFDAALPVHDDEDEMLDAA